MREQVSMMNIRGRIGTRPNRLLIVTSWLAACVLPTLAPCAEAAYRVIDKIPVAGDGGWDYVAADSAARRLYVSHDTAIVVLDLDTHAVLGTIPAGEDTHGAAIAREFGRGFISASDPGSVTIFDLETLAVQGKIRVGDDPNGIIYDPETKRIFTADRGSRRLTAIDAESGEIVATSQTLDGRTEHLASDSAGHVFLNMQDRNTTLKFDARSLELLATWPTEPCEAPSSMDMDVRTGRIFIGCRGDGMFIVLDAATGKLVAQESIGSGVDAAEFDPATGLVYLSTGGGDGVLSIFNEDTPDRYRRVADVTTRTGARTMAVDRETGRIYLPTAELGPAPPATPDNPRPRASRVPGTFALLVVGQ